MCKLAANSLAGSVVATSVVAVFVSTSVSVSLEVGEGWES
jgi:hypothetical protein